jgi:hypothetical protein
MKRRINHKSLSPRSSRLQRLFVGIAPLCHCDRMRDADAWLAIIKVRSVAHLALDPVEFSAFEEYACEFLSARGLEERSSDFGFELWKDGQPIAGAIPPRLPRS